MVTMPQSHSDAHADNIIHQGSLHLSDVIATTVLKHPDYPIKLVGGVAPIYMPLLKHKFPMLELSKVSPAAGACLLWDNQTQ
jgi:hypothetical protein